MILSVMSLVLDIPSTQLINQMPFPPPILGHQLTQQPHFFRLVLLQQRTHRMLVKLVRIPKRRLLLGHPRPAHEPLPVLGHQSRQFGILPIQILEGGAIVPRAHGILVAGSFYQQRRPPQGFHDGNVGGVIDAIVVFEFFDGEDDAAGDGGFYLVHLLVDDGLVMLLLVLLYLLVEKLLLVHHLLVHHLLVVMLLVMGRAGGLGGRIGCRQLIER
mmetsp:Transcript_29270/g.53018  ORF Transcript_29270/g.53018 Transcript_29270/m.53018 type:complete len:215 (+) Transcript_29270:1307-1951(+)